MPVSDIGNIGPVVREALRLRPSSILDLGIGVGAYGLLLRQYLDIAQGRLHPDEWEVIISGVEGFEKYRNPVWDMYTHVEIANFAEPEQAVRYGGNDLVLMTDSLEHLDQRTGAWLLDSLIEQNKHVIVSVPVGANYMEQTAFLGNGLEVHRHKWEENDFVVRGATIIHRGVCVVASIPGLYR